jgi:type I restriction enzyme R subunit
MRNCVPLAGSVQKNRFRAGIGQAVREWHTDAGPADYVLFVDKKAVGVIEAKRESEGQHLTVHESQTEGYAAAKLKWVNNREPLPFLYEATGIVTRFTDARDPKPRSREIFSFHRPETLRDWLAEGDSLRARLADLPPLNPSTSRPRNSACVTARKRRSPTSNNPSAKPGPRADPDGHRRRQDLHRHHQHLPPAQARRRQARPLSGRHQKPRRTGRAGNDGLRADRRQPQIHRAVHGAAAEISFVDKGADVCISTIQRLYSLLKTRNCRKTPRKSTRPS